jgi:hypothetical protein
VPSSVYSIRFDQKIAGTTIDRAFVIIENWLKTNGGKVKRERRPEFVQASHVRSLQPMGWRKDAKKAMRFELSQQASDVLVTVNISPSGLNASDVRSREDEARANWNELLGGLWTLFGETDMHSISKAVDWRHSLKRSNAMILTGIILIVAGIAASILNTTVLISGLVVGVLFTTNGVMSRHSAKRRIAQNPTN